MPSYLERIPLDVLTHVAFFTTDPSPTSPLDALLQLLLSCRHIHRLLSIESCPQLYARIFREKFDLGGHHRRERHGTRTTSCLAAELRVRRRVLRRMRLSQVDSRDVLGDLWTAYLMLLESDGLNELQLHTAGIGDWVLRVLRDCHSPTNNETDGHVLAVAVSVACLVLSHNQISSLPVGDRNQVLNLLRPYTMPMPKFLSTNVSGAVERRISVSTSKSQGRGPGQLTLACKISDGVDAHLPHPSYYSRFAISTPDLLTASVFLTFAFLEATPLQVPPHLPVTRAIAIATERHGPTMTDFTAFTTRKTPLVADSFLQCQYRESDTDLARERQRPSRSTNHDEDFYRIARHLHAPAEAWELLAYIPGLLTGVWEGCYMVAPLTSCPSAGTPDPDVRQDFLCRQPIQFRLEEYVTFSPWLPLPVETHDGFDGHVLRGLSASQEESTVGPRFSFVHTIVIFFTFRKRIQFSDGNAAESYHYEPFRLSGASESGRNHRHALDVVITGETPHRFEAAWGSYSFIGRVRLSDGLISLTRKPKIAGDDACGTWVFEGYLHSRSTFAGQWSTLSAPGQEGIGGIFSVSKTAQ
ncbi:hypothetical protein J3R83DRAFT_11375 [Lanmaoa asiatica]|nr:hypothetical protein J3R83DRAFT_11375 [Lanmaoa asiatica]